MAKTYDLTARLVNEPKFILLPGNKSIMVDTRKNTVLKIVAETDSSNFSPNDVEKVLTLALGEEGMKEVDALELDFDNYQKLFIAVMAAIENEEYEVVEKQFRGT